VAASIDITTAFLAALNFAYFARRFTAPGDERMSRRVAAAVLAVVSLGTAVECVALLALAAQGEAATPSSASWALVRTFPLAGSAAMFALVARRMVER
jgi:hypothetical protein